MSCWGIVVAAGSGRRFGGPKQHAELGGRPLWMWGRDMLLEAGARKVVVVGPVPGGIPGGARRRDSVAAGLAAVPDGVEHVLVHDAARPLAPAELAIRVLDRLAAGDCDGVVPAVAVRDTVKEVAGDVVRRTLDRSALVAVQTPQGFRVAALRAAHDDGAVDAPDDAALVEQAGGRVVTVAGDARNLKVTFPDDLELARAIIEMSGP